MQQPLSGPHDLNLHVWPDQAGMGIPKAGGKTNCERFECFEVRSVWQKTHNGANVKNCRLAIRPQAPWPGPKDRWPPLPMSLQNVTASIDT